jgi:hypothetical protein
MSDGMTKANGWNGKAGRWITVGGGIAFAAVAFVSLRGGFFTRGVRADFELPATVATSALADGIIEIPGEAPSLQAAIDAATPGTVIRLGEGSFVGPAVLEGKSVRIEGAGIDRTTFRGFGKGPALVVRGSETADAVVTGLTITGAGGETGFGLLADGTGATFGEVAFRLNAGGGACVRGGSPAFNDCRFEDNRGAQSGGGLRNEGGSPVLVGCTFTRNIAGTFGGAVFSEGGSISLIDCDLSDTGTRSGAWGGAVFGQGARIEAHRTQFTRNRAIEGGGAMYLMGGQADVSGCTFTGNLAESGRGILSRGAGVRLRGSVLTSDASMAVAGDVATDGDNVFNAGRDTDCNDNGIADTEELAAGWAKDIDGNGRPDTCDRDCNSNGIPDAYEIVQGWSADEDKDGMIDICAIRLGLVSDVNHDWIPDNAQQLGEQVTEGVTTPAELEAMQAKADGTDGTDAQAADRGDRETRRAERRAARDSAGKPSDMGISMPGMRMARAAAMRGK